MNHSKEYNNVSH